MIKKAAPETEQPFFMVLPHPNPLLLSRTLPPKKTGEGLYLVFALVWLLVL